MKQSTLACLSAATIACSASFFPIAAQAEDYDMDCAVILCMAGGFPAGCTAPWNYMIDRITSTPPKSPFGTCLQDDGTAYNGADVDWSFLSPTNAEAFVCPEGSSLYHSVSESDHGRTTVTAFCYTGTRTIGSRDDRTTVYLGKTAPEQKNFQTRITLERGTEDEFTPGLQKWWTDELRTYSFTTTVRTY